MEKHLNPKTSIGMLRRAGEKWDYLRRREVYEDNLCLQSDEVNEAGRLEVELYSSDCMRSLRRT